MIHICTICLVSLFLEKLALRAPNDSEWVQTRSSAHELMKMAYRERRILLAQDKDFGWLLSQTWKTSSFGKTHAS
jgi:predicted nuclease of predicted toxin-antitoxin system